MWTEAAGGRGKSSSSKQAGWARSRQQVAAGLEAAGSGGGSSRQRQPGAAAARAAAPGKGQKEERTRIICVGEQCDTCIAVPSAPADMQCLRARRGRQLQCSSQTGSWSNMQAHSDLVRKAGSGMDCSGAQFQALVEGCSPRLCSGINKQRLTAL